MTNSPYGSLAAFYDEINAHVPYDAWADYIVKLFNSTGIRVESVVDLACGTGAVTHRLAARGYDMIGVDWSPDMLAVAAGKGAGTGEKPLFICQDISNLDLYGTVDAAVCCLDGVSHISPEGLSALLERVRLFLNPGGVFIFDINSYNKLSNIDGKSFVTELESGLFICRQFYDAGSKTADFVMDIFLEKPDGSYNRICEEQREYAYTENELGSALKEAGFSRAETFGELSESSPAAEEERIFFMCIK